MPNNEQAIVLETRADGLIIYDRFPVEVFGAPPGNFWQLWPGEFAFMPWSEEPVEDPAAL
jgi:hypothetical protein